MKACFVYCVRYGTTTTIAVTSTTYDCIYCISGSVGIVLPVQFSSVLSKHLLFNKS